MNPLERDKVKLEQTLERARKSGDTKMVTWCENQLNQLRHYVRVK